VRTWWSQSPWRTHESNGRQPRWRAARHVCVGQTRRLGGGWQLRL